MIIYQAQDVVSTVHSNIETAFPEEIPDYVELVKPEKDEEEENEGAGKDEVNGGDDDDEEEEED